jgi:serine protease Do
VYEEYRPFGGAFGGSVSIPRLRESGTETRKVGGGSGFLVSADGLAVTNRHVVSDTSATYSLLFSDGTTAPVDVLARDEVLDIAILQIASTTDRTWPYLPLGNADDLRLGQPVVAIGNALAEFDNTVSSGVISGLSRSITARDQRGGAEQLERVIQTDAAINPGNSGGPLLNLRGEVIGVNVAASLEAQNIGFALPVNAIASVIESVKATGEIVRPFLGVRYRMVTESLVEENNLPITYGAIVLPGADRDQLAVIPGSPAALAGIREGDIILEVNKVSLEERSLASVLREQAVCKTITIKIWRNGTELLRSVTLEAM